MILGHHDYCAAVVRDSTGATTIVGRCTCGMNLVRSLDEKHARSRRRAITETESVQHYEILFTFQLEPPIRTLYLDEHVSCIRTREGETITEIRD